MLRAIRGITYTLIESLGLVIFVDRRLAVFFHALGRWHGTGMAGFPNLFMFLGPFGAAGNQSALMLESQMSYIVDAA